MKFNDAVSLLEQNVSRGIMLEGMGCLHYFVPARSSEAFIQLCYANVPVNVHWEVGQLRDVNITMKKGMYPVGRLSDGSFKSVVDDYFKNKRF